MDRENISVQQVELKLRIVILLWIFKHNAERFLHQPIAGKIKNTSSPQPWAAVHVVDYTNSTTTTCTTGSTVTVF